VGVLNVGVTGELDMQTAGQLRAALQDALADDDVTTVLIDLADVSFCDSSGINVLDEQYGVALAASKRMRITAMHPAVQRVLEIVGLLDALTGR
jgi:anti-sigma B factor antagonist